MSNGNQRLSRTSLIVVLMCAIVLFAIFFLSCLNLKNISTLQGSVQELSKDDSSIILLRHCNDDLVTAENHYRIYINSGDSDQKKYFLNDISNVLCYCRRISEFDTGFSKRLQAGINYKLLMYEAIQNLQRLEDSFTQAPDKDISVLTINKPIQLERMDRSFFKNYFSSSTDTVKLISEKKKKGFFKKLGSLFSNKDEDALSRKYIKGSVTEKKYIDSLQHETDSTISSLSTQVRDFYQRSVNRQLLFRRQLSAKERGLAATNLGMMGAIDAKIKFLLLHDEQASHLQKTMSAARALSAKDAIQKIALYSLVAILLLMGLLAYNIYRSNQYEKDLIEAKAHAEKMARVKSRFLSNMSHEIRTPLTAIMGFTEQISSRKNPEQEGRYLDAIQVSSGHLLNTVNDILDFSKLDAGKLRLAREPFLLQNAIDEVVFAFSLEARKKNILLTVSSRIPKNLWVLGDVYRFKQILYNLVSNAIKFTDKGQVEVQVSATQPVHPQILVTLLLKDTGIGIPADQMDFIFQEFAQATSLGKTDHLRSAKGTGLGLPICKMLAELQGGSIRAESTVGKGSVFTLTIPFERADETPVPPRDETLKFPEKKPGVSEDRKILVVEDNELNIMLITLLLDRWGYPHDVAKDGEEALSLFREKNYSLVLTDINVPKLTGIQLAALIRKDADKKKATLPLVALTADTLSEDFETYYQAGINKIIIKPFQEKEFRETVEAYMNI